MNLIKKRGFLILVLTVMLMVCACSNKNDAAEYNNSQLMPRSTSDSDNKNEAGYSAMELNNMEPSEDTSLPSDRKIIRNASLDIETSDATNLYEQIATYGNGLGGYEFSYNISHYEEYSVISAVFKVPPEKLNTFIHFIGENGKIINSSMSSKDITEDYFDMQTRLDTKRKTLERYYELLETADTMDKILLIQETIDNITTEIESYEGKLKVWNSLVDMATVDVYIRQNNDPVKIRKEIQWNTLTFEDMGYLIKSGFVSLMNTIVSVLQWILIAALVCSPVWLIGLCVFLVIRKRKKNRKNTEKAKDSSGLEDGKSNGNAEKGI